MLCCALPAAYIAAGVADRVTILEQDLMEVDVAEATVVMVYLVPKGTLATRVSAKATCRQLDEELLRARCSHSANRNAPLCGAAGMQKVAEKLRRELRPGTRIVCYLFRCAKPQSMTPEKEAPCLSVHCPPLTLSMARPAILRG